MNSTEFNSNWMARVDWQDLHTLIGYQKLVTLLDDAWQKTEKRLTACKSDKLTVKPFHGAVITFYAR